MERYLYGGSGHLPYQAAVLINLSDKPYEVHYGYDTTANGFADAIVAPPGGYVVRLTHGGADRRDFIKWLQCDDFSELERHALALPKAFSSLAILLPDASEPEYPVFSQGARDALDIHTWEDVHDSSIVVKRCLDFYRQSIV